MIIGNAERPRPFNKKYGRDLGLDYHFNRKAWMKKDLFFAWFHRLDLYIGATVGRKILLLIDNCSAHGKKKDLPVLHNLRVEFLPPNTTSNVQSLDGGIIAWVKEKYKRRLLVRAFENLETRSKKSTVRICSRLSGGRSVSGTTVRLRLLRTASGTVLSRTDMFLLKVMFMMRKSL